jgi:diguanylate cyclase
MLNREALFAAIAEAVADGGSAGVLVLRTQRLREFEWLFGYEAAEHLAWAMEARLSEALRPADGLFRIGECDFAMVLPRLQQRQHAALAAGKVVRTLHDPLQSDGRPVRVGIAVGIATWPEDGEDAATLCRRADEAATLAVHTRERHAFNTSVPRQLVAYDALYGAIAANRLETWLQPIRTVADGRLLGFESLSRWRHEGALIPPERFVATAEQTGLIEALTHWSLHSALRHCAPALRRRPDLGCSVNLSPRAMLDHGIVEQVDAALRLWGVPARALNVEITETAFVEDAERLVGALTDLHAMGVGVSIDDYGAGYSSLVYLRDFPVDEIKIDRSFIVDMVGNPRSARLAGAVIDLAHNIGAHVVAEGVETEAALGMLRAMGCDRYQGYLHGRPRPAGEVLAEIDDAD